MAACERKSQKLIGDWETRKSVRNRPSHRPKPFLLAEDTLKLYERDHSSNPTWNVKNELSLYQRKGEWNTTK